MTDVFISYSRNDRDQVRLIAEALESMGLKVWWDPDIPPGESFSSVIDQQLKESACILVCWSRSSVNSNWVQEEADDGMQRNSLIPVMIDDVDLPRGFKRLQTADLRNWNGDVNDANWQMIVSQVKKLVAGKQAAIAAERQAEARQSQERTRQAAPARAAAAPQAATGAPAKSGGGFLVPAMMALALIGVGAIAFFLMTKDKPAAIATGGDDTSLAANDARGDASAQPAEAAAEDRVDVAASAPTTENAGDAAPRDGAGAPYGVADDAASAPDPVAAAPVTDAPSQDGATAADAPIEDNVAPSADAPAPGESIRDCDACPELVVVSAGAFAMGAPDNERSSEGSEKPQVDITIAAPFAISAFEVTFDEWRACLDAGGCGGHEPSDMGWGEGRRPVVNVSYEDAQGYADWLSETTGQTYRLPSEAEWEYAARAGAATPFSFGESLSTGQANYNGNYPYGDAAAGAYRSRTTEVGSFDANAFGLYDMHGNVWEIVADCWRPNHRNASLDGAPADGACSQRVIKGGAWNAGGWRARAAHRKAVNARARDFDTGFRVVREL